MTPTRFVEAVAGLNFPSVFNPYSDRCSYFDLPDAPSRRRQNLRAQLEACLAEGVEAVWVGRDLGYRGGRRTGIALTDEPNLSRLAQRSAAANPILRATRGPMVTERTATVIWRSLLKLDVAIFTWNVFPLHPHDEGRPLTNRCHTKAERAAVRPVLLELLEMLRPAYVVAIGNDAEAGLTDLGVACVKVRHPSYGGVADFEAGIAAVHGGTLEVAKRGTQAPLF